MINVSGGNAGKWQHIGCDKVKIFLSILLFIRWWNLIYIICIQFLQGEHNIPKIRLYIDCIEKKSDVRFLPGFCGRLRFCLWKATNMLRINVKKASARTLECANCLQEWKTHMEDILNSIFPSEDLSIFSNIHIAYTAGYKVSTLVSSSQKAWFELSQS